MEDDRLFAFTVKACLGDPIVWIPAFSALNLKMNARQGFADDVWTVFASGKLLSAASRKPFASQHFCCFQFSSFSFLAAIHVQLPFLPCGKYHICTMPRRTLPNQIVVVDTFLRMDAKIIRLKDLR